MCVFQEWCNIECGIQATRNEESNFKSIRTSRVKFELN